MSAQASGAERVGYSKHSSKLAMETSNKTRNADAPHTILHQASSSKCTEQVGKMTSKYLLKYRTIQYTPNFERTRQDRMKPESALRESYTTTARPYLVSSCPFLPSPDPFSSPSTARHPILFPSHHILFPRTDSSMLISRVSIAFLHPLPHHPRPH